MQSSSRLPTPVLRKMFCMCDLTVSGETMRCSAICSFVQYPSSMALMIRCSLLVRLLNPSISIPQLCHQCQKPKPLARVKTLDKFAFIATTTASAAIYRPHCLWLISHRTTTYIANREAVQRMGILIGYSILHLTLSMKMTFSQTSPFPAHRRPALCDKATALRRIWGMVQPRQRQVRPQTG